VTLAGSKLVASLALGPRADDLAGLGVLAAALLAAGAVAIVHDLARVSAVHEERGFYVAAARALAVARAAPLAATWACASRAALALAALLGAVFLVASLGLSSGGRVALAFAAHHAGLAAAAWLRASWLAAAIRLLERAAPEA
jgi:dienelactone hydrolase